MKRLLYIFVLICVAASGYGQPYQVGDLYVAPDGSSGIVYYLFPDGSGGWVVALNDATYLQLPWGGNSDIAELPNYIQGNNQLVLEDTAGYASTQTIRFAQGNSNSYAAGLVDFEHGWYLPTIVQLRMLFSALPVIENAIINAEGTPLLAWCTDAATGDLDQAAYWSCEECSDNKAWCVSFNYGHFYPDNKNHPHFIRAVCTFSYTDSQASDVSYLWSTGANTPDITVSPTQTTTYTVTVSTSGGCADTVEQTIVVNSAAASEFTVAACESYTWNGTIYTESGDYPHIFTIANGCDSVVTLHLTVSAQPEAAVTTDSDTLCVGGTATLQTEVSLPPSGPVLHVPPVAIGDILCTDNSIVKPSAWPVAGKTAMGIVFYVDNTGEHGWALRLNNENSDNTMKWGGSGVDVPELNNISLARNALMDLDGYTNTQKILAAGTATTYPAAYSVDFANGWYLPASGQLRCIYSQLPVLNASLQIAGGLQFSMNAIWGYWSSTESDANNAWHLDENGQITSFTKNMTYRVRAVRNF